MIRRIFDALPGPAPLRAAIMVIVLLAALALLLVVFEQAGDLIDNGGVIQ